MFPLYNHNVTPIQDTRSLVGETRQMLANRRDRKTAERQVCIRMNLNTHSHQSERLLA